MTLDFVGHLRTESARFRDVLSLADPSSRVPSCPDWDAGDLLWHLTEVQGFWCQIVESRAQGRDGIPDLMRPGSHQALLESFDEWSDRLAAALDAADDDVPVWTWAPDQSVGFIRRRQAHEVLIHRLDAELVTGQVTPLPGPLAADGVLETLDIMYGGTPPWGTFSADGRGLLVSCSDTGDQVEVQLGRFSGTDPSNGTAYDEPDISVAPLVGAPQATIAGTADDLDAWLWHRRDDTVLTFQGSQEVLAAVRSILQQPID